jgi:ATP-dependent RNA helicase DDX24/MAK5
MGVEVEQPQTNDALQTFIFSATLSKDLQQNLKKRSRGAWKKQRKQASTLGELIFYISQC